MGTVSPVTMPQNSPASEGRCAFREPPVFLIESSERARHSCASDSNLPRALRIQSAVQRRMQMYSNWRMAFGCQTQAFCVGVRLDFIACINKTKHQMRHHRLTDDAVSHCKTTVGSSRRGRGLISLPIRVKQVSLNRRMIKSSFHRVILMHGV